MGGNRLVIMTKFAYFDSSITPISPCLAFYDTIDSPAPSSIPSADLLSITDSQWKQAIIGFWGVENGQLVQMPASAPTKSQLQSYAGSKASAMLANMRSYTADGVTLKSDATSATLANLMALAQWGAANPTASFNWIADDYSSTAITGAQIVAIAPMVGAYAQLIYGTELNAVLSQISSSTITTTAQIDAYGWTA